MTNTNSAKCSTCGMLFVDEIQPLFHTCSTHIAPECDAVCQSDYCGCYACVVVRDRTVMGIPEHSMWMIVCEKCGNKRCPHATDHNLDCSDSNEPGQPGSRYEAWPDCKPIAGAEVRPRALIEKLHGCVMIAHPGYAEALQEVEREFDSTRALLCEAQQEVAELRNEVASHHFVRNERDRLEQEVGRLTAVLAECGKALKYQTESTSRLAREYAAARGEYLSTVRQLTQRADAATRDLQREAGDRQAAIRECNELRDTAARATKRTEAAEARHPSLEWLHRLVDLLCDDAVGKTLPLMAVRQQIAAIDSAIAAGENGK